MGTEIKCIAKPSVTGNAGQGITISFDGKSVTAHGVSELIVTFNAQPTQTPSDASKSEASAEVADLFSELEIEAKDDDISEATSVDSSEYVVAEGESENDRSTSVTEQSDDETEIPGPEFIPPPCFSYRPYLSPKADPFAQWADVHSINTPPSPITIAPPVPSQPLYAPPSPLNEVASYPRSPYFVGNPYYTEPVPPTAPRVPRTQFNSGYRPLGSNRFGRQYRDNNHVHHSCPSAPKPPTTHRSQPNFIHQKSQAPLTGGIAQHYRNIGAKVPPPPEATHSHITNPSIPAPMSANNSFYSTAYSNPFQDSTRQYDGMAPLVESWTPGAWGVPNPPASSQPTSFPHLHSTGMVPGASYVVPSSLHYSTQASNHSDLNKSMIDASSAGHHGAPCSCF